MSGDNVIDFPRPPAYTGRPFFTDIPSRQFAAEMEALGMDQYRDAIDRIVLMVCAHGSDDMLKALDRHLMDACDIVSTEQRNRWNREDAK